MKQVSIKYKGQLVKISLFKDNTSIENSYRIRRVEDMKNILKETISLCSKYYAIHHRSISSMIREWRVHNLLYSMNIMKDRTKTVDLNLNQNICIEILYSILSFLYFCGK